MDRLGARRAGFVLSAINLEIVLKIADFTRRRDVIAKRGPARLDRRQQDGLD